jgi:hypothetical protein
MPSGSEFRASIYIERIPLGTIRNCHPKFHLTLSIAVNFYGMRSFRTRDEEQSREYATINPPVTSFILSPGRTPLAHLRPDPLHSNMHSELALESR